VRSVNEKTRTEAGPTGDTPGPRSSGRAPKGSSDRVLLVEDNPVNQRVTIAMLKHLGFCTDVVDNGVEAVIAATMVPYRAILMDCQIPVLNGYETTVEIRSQWGASRCSPIIAVTSSSTEPDRMRCFEAGMDGFLAKPLDLDSLAAGMARWAPDPTAPPVALDDQELHPTALDNPVVATDAERPALDVRVVGRLQRLGAAAGSDLLGQLATVFLVDADSRIVAMGEAIAQDDGPALIHSAHTLCGASANLGAAELARLCAKLATDGTVGDLENAKALLQSVHVELERVRRALLSPMPETPASAPPTLLLLPSPSKLPTPPRPTASPGPKLAP
jgi:CheY-like chemotaxis protein